MNALVVWLSALTLGSALEDRNLNPLAFLAGSWLAESGGVTIEEHWIPAKAGTMFGVSRTVRSDRTVAFEFLRIEARASGIFYVAQPNGRPPTDFELDTSNDDGVAVFRNPNHDHPKVIRYRRNEDGTLVVEIEGDEKGERIRQEFHFRRLDGPFPPC
jgi:hypothetical protein